MGITITITSVKYLYVGVFNDWSRLEDWISITCLVFYISVFLTVISLMMEVRGASFGGVIHSQGPLTTTVVINQQIPLQAQQQHQQYPQQNYYPAPQEPPPAYSQHQPPYNPGY